MPVSLEEKVKGAVRTDFILSARNCGDYPGIVSESPLLNQVLGGYQIHLR